MQQEVERAPCKYFQKGNCKFGAKCALAHILPDGRRVNHLASKGPSFNRISPEVRLPKPSGIHAELLQSQLPAQVVPPALSSSNFPTLTQLSSAIQDTSVPPPVTRRKVQPDPSIPVSPSIRSSSRTLGPLDAQLPSSLDSSNISWFARHGPIAASVPSNRHFGMPEIFTSHPTSPIPSLSIQPSTSLFTPNLGTSPHRTVFRRDEYEEHNDSKTRTEEVFSPTGSLSGSPSSSRFGALFNKYKLSGSPTAQAPIGSPLARTPRKTDMKPQAKEFKRREDDKDEEPFLMDI